MKASLRWSLAAATLLTVTVALVIIPYLGGERTDRVDVRQVAKAPAMPARAPEPLAAAAPSVAWTLPAGWTVASTKPMRLASFAVALAAGSGDCGLFHFPTGGDRLGNVNRWRGQTGLPPIGAAELDQALTTDTCAFGPFAWLDIRGPEKAFLAAIVPTPTGQCFVKLEAPAAQLEAARDGFLAFCRSLRP